MPTEEFGITLFYVVVGSVWVLGTDQILGYYMGDDWVAVALQSLKGLAFVFVTGLMLYLTLRRSFVRRRRAEEALRLSHERFELAARAATDAIYDWDLQSGQLWWSDSFHTLFGYTTEEVESTLDFWKEQLHPEERERVSKSLDQAIEKGQDTWTSEYRFRRKDGSYAFVHDRSYVLHDAQDQPIRMIGGMSDITERKAAQEKLDQSRRQLRALSAHLQSLREAERSRISREVHDELGQSLTALKMDLRWIEKRVGARDQDPSLLPILEKAVQAGEVADAAIATVQKIASELRPGVLDNLGLEAALRHEIGKLQERTGLACNIRLPEDPLQLSRETGTAVFRIFQETLTNIIRHAHATRVQVALRPVGDQVVLEVEDNGHGITAEDLASPKSLGLLGMKERAAVLGGEVVIQPGRQQGTCVRLRLPRSASDVNFWEQIQI